MDNRASVVSHLRVDNRRDPLTRLASADENASSSHPLPQGGEGSKINSPLVPLGERGSGVRGSVHYPIVKYYAGHHTRLGLDYLFSNLAILKEEPDEFPFKT